ncbi:MAG: 30S ribosomal protein S1, partial [Oscillochloris sp.]|nr:30S ribosomal protein S1 [Oscillochloris sp.]
RGGRRERRPQQAPVAESYSSPDFEEEFTGDATLEDLLSKFGGPSSNRKDRRGRDSDNDNDEEDEEEYSDRQERRQRDAIRRTLQQVGRDD